MVCYDLAHHLAYCRNEWWLEMKKKSALPYKTNISLIKIFPFCMPIFYGESTVAMGQCPNTTSLNVSGLIEEWDGLLKSGGQG